ncbi:Fic family protein [Methylobacterium sp. 37f]|uniref:Fic family protein n=1 Tax=Methylobacterium sp. 37f TaxID=2817058 RepID=UPI001FFDD7D2|nr:Fic family protein [Methylobacterium sp. 37f]MCK2053284.1 Fic family protein [Methylobacterium sp. 37f]
MKKSLLALSPTGVLVPTLAGQWAFDPADLPPALDNNVIIQSFAEATLALGELNGIGRTLPNPYLLIAPLQAKEALTSSSMEGTFTTAAELLLLDAGLDQPSTTAEAREVRNYARALREAIDSLNRLPLCLRTIRDAHATLLGGLGRGRGGYAKAGEFRDQQNWIGSRSIQGARYIPPPPQQARERMHALESYIQREDRAAMPPLIDAALIHYQFETIHPFPDGNGRVGRILIPLFLFERGTIRQPLLYLSPYLERHKDEYIDRMFEVSRRGDWAGWIAFFLRVVRDSCIETIAVADRLLALQAAYRARLSGAGRSSLPLAIVDHLFQHPIVSIPQLQERLGTTYVSAQKNLGIVEEAGIVEPVEGTSHPRYFRANDILNIISDAT